MALSYQEVRPLTSYRSDDDESGEESGDSDEDDAVVLGGSNMIPDDWSNFKFYGLLDDENIERAMVEHFRYMKKLKSKCRKRIAKLETYDKKVECFDELRQAWQEISPQLLVAAITTLGQDADDYLKTLSFKLALDEWTCTDKTTHLEASLRNMRREPAGKMLIVFSDWDDSVLGSEADEGPKFIVSGATGKYEKCNGIYKMIGYYSGKHKYQHLDNESIIFYSRQDKKWKLHKENVVTSKSGWLYEYTTSKISRRSNQEFEHHNSKKDKDDVVKRRLEFPPIGTWKKSEEFNKDGTSHIHVRSLTDGMQGGFNSEAPTSSLMSSVGSGLSREGAGTGMGNPWSDASGWSQFDYIMHPFKTEYKVHYTTINTLIDPEDIQAQIYIVKALHDTGPRSDVYNSIAGRAIQEHAWDSVFPHFCFNLTTDILFLVLQVFVNGAIHNGKKPEDLVLVMICTLSVHSIIAHGVLETIWTIMLYGKDFPMRYLSAWNLFILFLEVYSSIILLSLAYFGDDIPPGGACNSDACWAYSHPNFIASAIFLKWMQLIISLLCLEKFGDGTVLPALHAVSQPESLTFILVLLLFVLSAWQTYWAFPISENIDALRYKGIFPVFSLIKVFRLLLLQDFDVWELEGVDEQLDADGTFDMSSGNITMTGEIDDGSRSSRYHFGLTGFFVIYVIIGVMLTNVWIGQVSTLYEEGKAHKHQIYQNFKAQYTVKLLVFKHYMPWLPFYSCRSGRRSVYQGYEHQETKVHSAKEIGDVMDGVWVAYDKAAFIDDEELVEKVQQIDDKIDQILDNDVIKKVDDINRKVSDMDDRMKSMEEMLQRLAGSGGAPGRAVAALSSPRSTPLGVSMISAPTTWRGPGVP